MKKVHEKLKSYRNALRLSQEYVARQMGVARTTIVAIEQGNRSLKVNEIELLSEIYGVSVNEMLNDKEPENSDDVKMFARTFSELSIDDRKEVMNLIDFKKKLREESLGA